MYSRDHSSGQVRLISLKSVCDTTATQTLKPSHNALSHSLKAQSSKNFLGMRVCPHSGLYLQDPHQSPLSESPPNSKPLIESCWMMSESYSSGPEQQLECSQPNQFTSLEYGNIKINDWQNYGVDLGLKLYCAIRCSHVSACNNQCICNSKCLYHCRIGPTGSAVCAYRADNSFNTGLGGLNQGIFDIFRGDLQVGNSEEENTFVEVRNCTYSCTFDAVPCTCES